MGYPLTPGPRAIRSIIATSRTGYLLGPHGPPEVLVGLFSFGKLTYAQTADLYKTLSGSDRQTSAGISSLKLISLTSLRDFSKKGKSFVLEALVLAPLFEIS